MPFFDQRTLKVNALSAIILAVAEKMLEEDFVCSCNEDYRNVEVFLHFLIPILFCLVVLLQLLAEYEQQSYMVIKTFLFSAFLWIVLLLIDGRYVACAVFSPHAPCNNTIDVKELQSTSEFFLSKLVGFLLLYSVLLLAFLVTAVGHVKKWCNQRNNANTALYNSINPESTGQQE